MTLEILHLTAVPQLSSPKRYNSPRQKMQMSQSPHPLQSFRVSLAKPLNNQSQLWEQSLLCMSLRYKGIPHYLLRWKRTLHAHQKEAPPVNFFYWAPDLRDRAWPLWPTGLHPMRIEVIVIWELPPQCLMAISHLCSLCHHPTTLSWLCLIFRTLATLQLPFLLTLLNPLSLKNSVLVLSRILPQVHPQSDHPQHLPPLPSRLKSHSYPLQTPDKK